MPVETEARTKGVVLQTKLFDAVEGDRRKRLGMERAQSARAEVLHIAQGVAESMARRLGEITIDDVYMRLGLMCLNPQLLGNAAGSVFCDKKLWEFTGQWVKSKRTTNHGRMIRVWRLK